MTRSHLLPDSDLEPVVDDFSAYIRSGRIKDSSVVLDDAAIAERLGFRRIWLSERYDLKEAGVLLGGMAARTSRIGIATGALFPGSRPPILTAALGATLHSTYGPRFTLGLGRSMGEYIANANMKPISFTALEDYATMFRQLWAGEEVHYDGPIGTFEGLRMADTYPGPPPEIWSVMFGGPKACKVAAAPIFDGVLLQPFMTVEAVGNSLRWLREECDRIGRDFATLRVCLPMVTAPGLPDEEARLLMHARMVTYLGQPGMSAVYQRLNKWDAAVGDAVRSHPLVAHDPDRIDHHFHRADLVEVAKLVPDEWMYETSAAGDLPRCVDVMRRYKDTGIDEITTYGSTPEQNAGLIRAWREASRQRPGAPDPISAALPGVAATR